MTPERWDRVRDLFHAALDVAPAERPVILAASGQDPGLRAEVETLLRSEEQGSDLLDRPVAGDAWHVLQAALDGKPNVPLKAGATLGPYEILAPIGAGGMGEVYRARDLRLKREVALKVLPAVFATDPERMARFRRESEVLASLNHPNIAQIYGVEDRALVMELVDGKTLSGPLPIRSALTYARQMAEALEYAHEKGIVHRDLKPANVKVTHSGTVKVLDFGLAKATEKPAALSGDPSMSPTESIGATHSGMIMGTAAYMSPEQASGQPVDKRTDIWAFGAVLWEMLAGTRLFQGESVAHTLAEVLRAEVDFSKLPRDTPLPIRDLLARCLDRDVTTRLRDLGEARVIIQKYLAAPANAPTLASASAASAPTWTYARALGSRPWVAWSVTAVLAVAAIAGWLRGRQAGNQAPSLALTVVPPAGKPLDAVGSQVSAPEISPDGLAVLFAARGGYYVRRLDSLDAIHVPGSEAITGAAFWSPDSTTVVYPSSRRLMKVRMPDGAPEMVVPLSHATRGGSWSTAGTILIASFPLLALAPSGGPVVTVDFPELPPGEKKSPQFLPGSEDFLFLFVPDDDSHETEICLATLRDGKGVNVARLLKSSTAARYTGAAGRILFVREDNLYSQKLNRKTRRLEGDAELVARGVASQPHSDVGRGDFSVSESGVVAWRPGKAALSQVTSFDRAGNQIDTSGPPSSIFSIVLSPDQTRILARGQRAWILDAGQLGVQTLPANTFWLGWSSDGLGLLGLGPNNRLVEYTVDGAGAVHDLGRVNVRTNAQDISPDGRQILWYENGQRGMSVSRVAGPEEQPVTQVFGHFDGIIANPRFSPDGRWVLYREGGGLFAQPFPGPGNRQLIAPSGSMPEWRGDGKEIVYLAADALMAVVVETAGKQFRFGPPRKLFSGLNMPAGANASIRPLAVSRDGSRIYFVQGLEQPDSNMIHVKMGWLK